MFLFDYDSNWFWDLICPFFLLRELPVVMNSYRIFHINISNWALHKGATYLNQPNHDEKRIGNLHSLVLKTELSALGCIYQGLQVEPIQTNNLKIRSGLSGVVVGLDMSRNDKVVGVIPSALCFLEQYASLMLDLI